MSPRSRRPAPLAHRAAEGLLWLLLFFCPLALGSAPHWTLVPIVLAAVLAGGLSLAGALQRGGSFSLPLFAAVPGLGAGLCLLQLVPLPGFLLGVVSPAARELQEFALLPLGLSGPRPVSLDPAQTWRELSKHLAYLSVFVCAVQLSRSRRSRRRLQGAVALAGTAVAIIGLGHLLFDSKALFGLYRFMGTPPLVTPFGNPNHLAGYLVLAGTMGLGLALSASDRQRALLWGVAYVAMGASALLSLSRGGIAFFVFAQLLFAALLLKRRAAERAGPPAGGRRPPWARLSGVALAGTLSVFAVGAYVAFDRIAAELETVDSMSKLRESKLELYPSMAEAAGHFSMAGMGRGAFELGYSRYQTAYPGTLFTHAENLVLHLWAELGLLPAAALIGLALWAMSRLLRRAAIGVEDLAVLAGVFALALHNLFDFSLELPVCAVSACVLLGTASRPDEHARPEPVRRGWLWGVAGLGLLAVFALLAGRHTAGAAEEALTARIREGASLGEVRALALRLIDAHPADYLLYDLAGVAYAQSQGAGPRGALAFVNRALYLRPLDAEAHRVAARSLARLGNEAQALLEFRLAAESGMPRALDEGLELAKTVEQVRRLAAPEPKPLEELVGRLRAKKRVGDARELLSWAVQELKDRRDADGLWLLEGTFRREQLDYPGALAALDRAERLNPGWAAIGLSRAGVLSDMGRKEQAIALLQSMVVRHPDDVQLAFTLAQHLNGHRKPALAREALLRIGPFLKSLDQRARLFVMEGRSFELEGRFAKALQAYQSAARVQPGAAGHQYLIAQAYERLEKFSEALQALRAGARLDGGSPSVKSWIERMEAKERQQQEALDGKLLEQKPELEAEE